MVFVAGTTSKTSAADTTLPPGSQLPARRTVAPRLRPGPPASSSLLTRQLSAGPPAPDLPPSPPTLGLSRLSGPNLILVIAFLQSASHLVGNRTRPTWCSASPHLSGPVWSASCPQEGSHSSAVAALTCKSAQLCSGYQVSRVPGESQQGRHTWWTGEVTPTPHLPPGTPRQLEFRPSQVGNGSLCE